MASECIFLPTQAASLVRPKAGSRKREKRRTPLHTEPLTLHSFYLSHRQAKIKGKTIIAKKLNSEVILHGGATQQL